MARPWHPTCLCALVYIQMSCRPEARGAVGVAVGMIANAPGLTLGGSHLRLGRGRRRLRYFSRVVEGGMQPPAAKRMCLLTMRIFSMPKVNKFSPEVRSCRTLVLAIPNGTAMAAAPTQPEGWSPSAFCAVNWFQVQIHHKFSNNPSGNLRFTLTKYKKRMCFCADGTEQKRECMEFEVQQRL